MILNSARTARRFRPRSGSRQGWTLIELLVVIVIIIILAGLLLPGLTKAKAKAKNIACVGQLRQLGVAVRLYADDHQNRLPSAELLPSRPASSNAPLPRICDVLRTYVGGAAATTNQLPVFKCPSDMVGRFALEGSSYEWNTDLNGRRMDETRSAKLKMAWTVVSDSGEPVHGETEMLFPPESTPLLLDYEDFHPRPPKSGKNIVFLDGHVTHLKVPE